MRFMDGRDTLPTTGAGYLEELQQKFAEYGVGKLASVSGRYFAMDRDLRWEKERKAFDAMVTGDAEGGSYRDAVARVRESYNNGVTDEFIEPFVCVDENGEPVGTIADDDAVHLLQLSRGPRAADYAGAGAATVGLTANGGRELPKAAELDAEIPLAQRADGSALRDDDAVRPEVRAADGDSAGEHG